MQQFFILKLNRYLRLVNDWGVNPILGVPILILLFYTGSYFLFQQVQFALYLYLGIALFSIASLGTLERNTFMKMIFTSRDYRLVRVIENILVAIPFVFFLTYQFRFLEICLLLFGSSILAFSPTYQAVVPVLKTPFWKWPFEFSSGFRKSFWLFPFSVFVVYKAIEVGNFNLGIFGMEVIFFISLLYYLFPEPEFYVWVHQTSPQMFLLKKIGIAMVYSSFTAIPIAISLAYFFPGNILMIIVFLFIGYGYLITVILAKYASYPKSISLPQAIVLAMTLYYPVIIIGVIPIVFFQASNKLKVLLK